MKPHRKSSKSSFGPPHAAAFVAGGTLAVLFISGAAVAVTDTNFTYTSAKTGYLAIDAADLASNSDGLTYSNSPIGGLATSGTLGCFSTGVKLPQGAVIKTLVIYFAGLDEDDVAVQFFRQRFSNGDIDDIASKSFTDFAGTRKVGTAPIESTTATVNNLQFSYGFRVCVDPGGKFFNARVAYTYTNAGD